MTSKPDECIICYEKLNEEHPLECGHWLHISCVEKHFKPECPICRAPLHIEVKGTSPESYIPFVIQEQDVVFIQEIHDHIDEYFVDDSEEIVYDSDEENPFGDDYDYPDEEED